MLITSNVKMMEHSLSLLSNNAAVLLVVAPNNKPAYAMATRDALRRGKECARYFEDWQTTRSHKTYDYSTSPERCDVIEKYDGEFYYVELPADSFNHARGIVKRLRAEGQTEV